MMRAHWLRIALVLMTIAGALTMGRVSTRAAEALTLELRPTTGPNGTRITLIGRGAAPFSQVGYIHGGFGKLDDCLYSTTSGQGLPGGSTTAGADGTFTLIHTVAENPNVGAIRFLLTGDGGRQRSEWSCFTIVPSVQSFPQTGKSVGGAFLAYWYANGGLAQQGYPITDEFVETNPSDGKRYTVQYFERARFELHPENQAPYNVLLGLLGTEQFRPRYPGGIAPVGGDPFAGDSGGRECAPFDQTGQTVCGAFLRYWQANGGLAQQGYPLGPVFLETNPTDGRQYPTQYFERARFEYHREFANTSNAVLLGLLGREQYLAKYQPGGTPAPPPPPAANPAPRAGTQITITPRQGPNSTLFVVTGVGFSASTTYYLQIVSQDGKTAINFDDASTKSDVDGVLLAGFSFGSAVAAGRYTAQIATAVSGGQVLATTSFTLTGASGSRSGPDVVVTPSQGRGGDTFILTGTGFAPNGVYTLRVQTENRQTTINFNNSDLQSDADGVILSGFSLSAQRPTGSYIVEVLSKAGTPAALASTTFSLTGAAASPPPAPSATPQPPTAVPTPTPVPQPPAPTPIPTNPRAGCDPSYPTICLPPPPPDLDCGQIPYRNFPVNKPDPHRFDNDNDGIGCES